MKARKESGRDPQEDERDGTLPTRPGAESKKEFIQGYLHAHRLPPAQAAQARQRARAEARKKGRTVQQRTLALAEWVLIFTTLAPEVLPTETVMALYRVRWQVELVIKRLKSILNIDHLRARKNSVWPIYISANCSVGDRETAPAAMWRRLDRWINRAVRLWRF
jgi:hypothetical protein